MREFAAEVEVGETIKGRQSLDSPWKPQDCALQARALNQYPTQKLLQVQASLP